MFKDWPMFTLQETCIALIRERDAMRHKVRALEHELAEVRYSARRDDRAALERELLDVPRGPTR